MQVEFITNKRLIYGNLLNGVPVAKVAENYRMSEKEIAEVFDFVSRKIKSYCFERGMPWVGCDTIPQAQKDRRLLLDILPKVNLSTEPKYAKITSMEITKPEDILQL